MFVTLEGPEGAGKSTVIRTLGVQLTDLGFNVVTTREPGDSSIGRQVRELLLEGSSIDRRTELLLFLADRAQHIVEVVRPALSAGKIVLCDRFVDSTIVYQGHARGLNLQTLRSLNQFATDGLTPELTLLFDLDVQIGLSRISRKDRLDSEPIEFHQKVREGFLAESRLDPRRWEILDASQPVEIVTHSALAFVLKRQAEVEHEHKSATPC